MNPYPFENKMGMKIFYNKENIRIEIPMDYCQKDTMKELCSFIVSPMEITYWQVDGLYLNHSLDEEDISMAQKNLEKLYYLKQKTMNISENQGVFFKDSILLNKTELIEYFADFAIFYMEVTIYPKDISENIIKFGTDADADFVYVYIKENKKTYIQNILRYIGICKLRYVQINESDFHWKDIEFNQILFHYPEISYAIQMKILKLEQKGWTKKADYVTTYGLSKRKKLVYQFCKNGLDCIEIPILMLHGHWSSSILEVKIL